MPKPTVRNEIESLRSQLSEELKKAFSSQEIEALRVKYLGKKGPVQALMPLLKTCSDAERPALGQAINALKAWMQEVIDTSFNTLLQSEKAGRLSEETLDVTLPGRRRFFGRVHLLGQIIEEVADIHRCLGFSVQTSPELETEYYNYDGLNYPHDHPARDAHDTYYIADGLLLRSHTTAFQQHLMEAHAPPMRFVNIGKCYRNETISSRSHVLFHQFDAFYVDKGVTFADLLGTLKALYSTLFRQEVKLRVRPSYFPFVEPGLEVDVFCTKCTGEGCSLCKHSGWLEVCGAGMIHPEVLKEGGVDPEEYSGFAWGGGVERIALLRHGIDDIRLFLENDLRFLDQF